MWRKGNPKQKMWRKGNPKQKVWRKGNPKQKMWRKGNPKQKMWREGNPIEARSDKYLTNELARFVAGIHACRRRAFASWSIKGPLNPLRVGLERD